MNILPKKRWHVRTKENIARVRKDEAEAAEKEKQEQGRIDTANREARLNLLKLKSKERLQGFVNELSEETSTPPPTEHLNLFSDLEHAISSTNKEHEKEVKEKREEYEKQIGYLTYLGQDTNEALKKKNWYEVAPESSRYSRSCEIKQTYDKLILKDKDGEPIQKEVDVKDGEVSWKAKQKMDPIFAFKKHYVNSSTNKLYTSLTKKPDSGLLPVTKNMKKHNKAEKNDKEGKLKKLREARVKREQQEKHRTEMFLKGLNKETIGNKEEVNKSNVKQKYNSQFNPELARQNYQ